jgi:quercetin dioxygenase-like cupin family protein
MISNLKWTAALVLAGLIGFIAHAQTQRAAAPQAHKPAYMTRIFTGPDGLAHAEEVEINLDPSGAFKMNATGAELHRMSPSANADWHVGPRRQYVITLKGTGELEVSGGKKIPLGPGQIDLIEDLTGKGHITRNFEDRITLQIPLAADSGR